MLSEVARAMSLSDSMNFTLDMVRVKWGQPLSSLWVNLKNEIETTFFLAKMKKDHHTGRSQQKFNHMKFNYGS